LLGATALYTETISREEYIVCRAVVSRDGSGETSAFRPHMKPEKRKMDWWRFDRVPLVVMFVEEYFDATAHELNPYEV